MTNIEKSIKLAVEGGWQPKDIKDWAPKLSENNVGAILMLMSHYVNIWFCDPEFFQALGKGLGNKDIMRCEHYNPKANEQGEKGCASDLCTYAGYKDPKMMFESFMQGIWYGKTAEEALGTIISN